MIPTSYEVRVIGVIRMPPSAPRAADIAKLMNSTPLVSMPTSSAARRLKEVASMALPVRVRLKKYHSSDHDHRGDAQHPQALGQQGGAQDLDRRVAREGRQAVRALAQEDLHQAADHQRGADGDDDEGHRLGALDRLDGQLLHQHAHHRRHQDRQQQAPPAGAARPG